MHVSADLFADSPREPRTEQLGAQAFVLRAFAAGSESLLLDHVERIAAQAPFRHLTTPGGYQMSVAMTNCGEVGWISDRTGYRYDALDPLSQRPWPIMPAAFLALAGRVATIAGFPAFEPDACLINRYQPGTRLSLHRDYDEKDRAAPIVSVSIGVPAIFQWGGLRRNDRTRRVPLESGDVVVWGGESRLVYHGIAALAESTHPLTGSERINLTFRKAR